MSAWRQIFQMTSSGKESSLPRFAWGSRDGGSASDDRISHFPKASVWTTTRQLLATGLAYDGWGDSLSSPAAGGGEECGIVCLA